MLFRSGKHLRDFTYIDDVVESIFRLSGKVDSAIKPYRIFNIGNEQPVLLGDIIQCLEAELGKTAKKKYLTLQAGDMLSTASDSSELEAAIGYKPKTPISEGIGHFVKWYFNHYPVA